MAIDTSLLDPPPHEGARHGRVPLRLLHCRAAAGAKSLPPRCTDRWARTATHLNLLPGVVLRLPGHGAREVHADQGRLWVTCEGEPDDWFVLPGRPVQLPVARAVVIENDSAVPVQVTVVG